MSCSTRRAVQNCLAVPSDDINFAFSKRLWEPSTQNGIGNTPWNDALHMVLEWSGGSQFYGFCVKNNQNQGKNTTFSYGEGIGRESRKSRDLFENVIFGSEKQHVSCPPPSGVRRSLPSKEGVFEDHVEITTMACLSKRPRPPLLKKLLFQFYSWSFLTQNPWNWDQADLSKKHVQDIIPTNTRSLNTLIQDCCRRQNFVLIKILVPRIKISSWSSRLRPDALHYVLLIKTA